MMWFRMTAAKDVYASAGAGHGEGGEGVGARVLGRMGLGGRMQFAPTAIGVWRGGRDARTTGCYRSSL